MLFDLVFYAILYVGAIDVVGVGVLVQLRLRATMGSSSFVLLLSRVVMGLCMALCTLVDGVSINGTLGDGGISTSVCGGGVDSIIDFLIDLCMFTCDSVFVKSWDCLVGAVLLAAGLWRLIKLLDAVASCSKSLIYVYPFPFDIPLSDCLRLRMALTN